MIDLFCSKCGIQIRNKFTTAGKKGLCKKRCDGIARDRGGYPLDPDLRKKYKEEISSRVLENKQIREVKKILRINKPQVRKIDREHFYDSREWKVLRYKVLLKYNRKCMCCHAVGIELHVDHIKPVSLYPDLKLEISNLQVLCRDCNLGKSNLDQSDFRI